VFAILPSLGWHEMFLLGLIGLLLYGRNLPQAGKTLGRYVAQFRRGFQDFKDQMDRDESLREMRKTIDDTKREMQRATAVPQAIANPAHAMRTFAQDALAAPVDGPSDAAQAADDVADEPPPAASPSPQADKDPYADRREDHGSQPT
jgi:sec-independent protein translocase protein TatA